MRPGLAAGRCSSPLKGPDDKTWAIAQGALSVGGFTASGIDRIELEENHTTVGRLPTVPCEATAPTAMRRRHRASSQATRLHPRRTRMRDAIVAKLVRQRPVGRLGHRRVPIPTAAAKGGVPQLIAQLEAIEVEPHVRAKVIVDGKTGTIVIGEASPLALPITSVP